MSGGHQAMVGFLERFFGEGNEIQWSTVRPEANGGRSRALEPFLRECRADWERLVLPRVKAGRLWWYALAREARSARILRDELLAFVGPSYSDFQGQYARLDPGDPVEMAALELSGRNVFRLEVFDQNRRDDCRQALLKLLEVRSRKPRGVRPVPRPPGRILRDFELAVQSHAHAEATGYLDELRQHGGIGARNILFLEVHLHDVFEEWSALDALLDSGAIVQARRPSRVTQTLIRAVYRRELARFEQSGQADQALRHFKDTVLPQFGRLYSSATGLQGPEVVKSFLLAAAASDPPQVERRDTLLERHPVTALDRPYVEALARLIPDSRSSSLPAREPEERARSAFATGDLDTAMALLVGLPPSLPVMELMVRCAREIGSIEATGQALAVLERAPDEVREAFDEKPRLRRMLEELRQNYFAAPVHPLGDDEGAAPPRLPGNWMEWIERVTSDAEWLGTVEVARQGAQEWSVEELTARPAMIQDFADRLLAAVTGPAAESLSMAMPHLLEFFVGRAGANRAFSPVQLSLLDALLYVETRTLESLRAAGLLLESLMRSGISSGVCQRVVDDIREAWLERPAFDLLDWAIDLLESLVTLQVAPIEAQVRFGVTLLNEMARWRDRATSAQVALFRQLCREGNIDCDTTGLHTSDGPSSAKAEDGSRGTVGGLTNKSVALYSLRPEVLNRVRDVLAEIAPGAQVRIYADEVGSPALRSAARNADVFVIVTGAAKHAATEFIEANRPGDAVTLRCHSTGSACVLRVLMQV